MSQSFGKLNRRPLFTPAPTPNRHAKPKLPPRSKASIVLFVYVAGAIAFLGMAVIALHA